MRSRTPKRAAAERKYLVARRRFLEDNPNCARCGERASEVHHMAGRRGDALLDEARWLPLCSADHRWVTEHPRQAIADGWSLSRVAAPRVGLIPEDVAS